MRTTGVAIVGLMAFALLPTLARGADPSTIQTSISANLRPFAANIPVPPSFDEHGHESELPSGLRFDLRRLEGPTYTVRADGSFEVYAKYYGDIQYRLGPVSLCHLGNSPGVWEPDKNWLLIEARISARPTVVKDGTQWVIQATDVNAAIRLAPGSDSHCTLLNFPVESKLNELLSGPIRAAAVNALNGIRLPIPVEALWQAIDRTYTVPVSGIPGGAIACVNPNVSEIILGRLHSISNGTIDNVELPLTLILSPIVSLGQGAACPAIQSPPPNIHSS
jgi:hypothetical protein